MTLAMRPSTSPDGAISLPCSSREYHVTLIPALWATSSRRNPCVRRLLPNACSPPDGSMAVNSRCLRRNSPSVCCRNRDFIIGYFVSPCSPPIKVLSLQKFEIRCVVYLHNLYVFGVRLTQLERTGHNAPVDVGLDRAESR